MKIVILAGGFGTRLSEQTGDMPKPMIEIGGRPLLWHIMKGCSVQGFQDFVIALGYKGDVIKRYFLHYAQLESDLLIRTGKRSVETQGSPTESWNVELIDTGRDTMTGGRLRRLKPALTETFIFTYGDGIANVDLQKLVAFHKSHKKLATVTAVELPERFGRLKLDKDAVKIFDEKPKTSDDWINGGFFVLEPEVMNYISGDDISWEREPCAELAREGELMAYRHRGFWQCVDTLNELRKLRDVWDSGSAPWKTWK